MNEIKLLDVQNGKPENEIELERVGIKGLKKFAIIKRPTRTYHMRALYF